MATFVHKVLQCRPSGISLRRSVLSVQNGLAYGKIFRTTGTALFREHHCCCINTKHTFYRNGINTSSAHSFHACTTFSSSKNAPEGSVLTTENLIEAWFNEASPFGKVHVRDVPFDVHIQPLNALDYPELNKSMVKLYYNASSGKLPVGHILSEMGSLSGTKVCAEGETLDVTCNVPAGVKLPLLCIITVPLKFDVVVEGGEGGSVVIRGLESDSVCVHMKQGDCHLTNMKTGSVRVQCEEGNITTSKQLLGAIQLQCANNGSIRCDRLQGVSVECRTETGDIDIKTVYADKSTCHSVSGGVHIRDCHGHMTVDSRSGNMTVDSMDGRLSAKLGSGSADVYVTRQDGVEIRSEEGDITLRFSEDGSCSLDLEASDIEQEDSLSADLNPEGKGFLKAETEHTVRASAPQGKITLKKQDWLSAIKLKLGNSTP